MQTAIHLLAQYCRRYAKRCGSSSHLGSCRFRGISIFFKRYIIHLCFFGGQIVVYKAVLVSAPYRVADFVPCRCRASVTGLKLGNASKSSSDVINQMRFLPSVPPNYSAKNACANWVIKKKLGDGISGNLKKFRFPIQQTIVFNHHIYHAALCSFDWDVA